MSTISTPPVAPAVRRIPLWLKLAYTQPPHQIGHQEGQPAVKQRQTAQEQRMLPKPVRAW